MANKWMSQLTKDFGAIAADMKVTGDSIIRMPSPSLNWAVGNGGILRGKAACLFGPESGGKSLLMQLIIKEIQRLDPNAIAVLFDAEYAFNADWFKKLGGDPTRLVVRQTNDPLKIFDWIENDLRAMIQDGAPVQALGIDSVKSIRYPKDHKKQSTDLTMGGGGASYLGPALKAILPVIREHNLTTLMVQQVYEELDPMKALSNPYKVPDGRALKHFCDYMLQVERVERKDSMIFDDKMQDLVSKANNLQIGHTVKVKVKKNRCGAPFRTAQFKLTYTDGIIDTINETIDLAMSLGVIYHPVSENTGKPNPQSWKFANYDEIRGQGAFRDWVHVNPKIADEILSACNACTDEQAASRNGVVNTDDDIKVDLDALDD